MAKLFFSLILKRREYCLLVCYKLHSEISCSLEIQVSLPFFFSFYDYFLLLIFFSSRFLSCQPQTPVVRFFLGQIIDQVELSDKQLLLLVQHIFSRTSPPFSPPPPFRMRKEVLLSYGRDKHEKFSQKNSGRGGGEKKKKKNE